MFSILDHLYVIYLRDGLPTARAHYHDLTASARQTVSGEASATLWHLQTMLATCPDDDDEVDSIDDYIESGRAAHDAAQVRLWCDLTTQPLPREWFPATRTLWRIKHQRHLQGPPWLSRFALSAYATGDTAPKRT